MIRVIVAGGLGRMGGEVVKLVRAAEDIELAGILERPDHPEIGKPHCEVEVVSDIKPLLDEAEVVVDFTSPAGLLAVLEQMNGSSLPLVSGSTGLSEEQFKKLKKCSQRRAILWSPNMSLGVNLLFKLTAEAARALRDYDVEILEMHHRHKKDAPSGTAKKLSEIVKQERKIEKVLYGRQGFTGERHPEEMAVLALRGGDVAGEHTVYFATEGERLELTHRASSRLAFARGTLQAIRFIVGKPPGFYEYSALLEED